MTNILDTYYSISSNEDSRRNIRWYPEMLSIELIKGYYLRIQRKLKGDGGCYDTY